MSRQTQQTEGRHPVGAAVEHVVRGAARGYIAVSTRAEIEGFRLGSPHHSMPFGRTIYVLLRDESCCHSTSARAPTSRSGSEHASTPSSKASVVGCPMDTRRKRWLIPRFERSPLPFVHRSTPPARPSLFRASPPDGDDGYGARQVVRRGRKRLRRPGSERQLAVDLGTANTVVYQRGSGVVVFEPSVVAVDDRTGEVHAVVAQARRLLGRTPAHIRAIRPLRHGVIADFETTEQMLRHFIRRVISGYRSRADVMVCIPSGITGVERSAVEDATLAAGASRAYLIEEPLAAAIGADLPVAEAAGSLVVDVGGGTSEMAVTAL